MQMDNTKEDRLQNWLVVLIERTIYENTTLKRNCGQWLAFRRKWVSTVGTALPDPTVAAMDIQFGFLVLGYFLRFLNGFPLGAVGDGRT